MSLPAEDDSDVIEEAPTHDGTPCFTAWQAYWERDDQGCQYLDTRSRPLFSIQIYDTTPNSRDKQHLRALAEHIHKSTWDDRTMSGENQLQDRLDVYGLALPADTPESERITRCVAHQRAEIEARNSTGKSDFYISWTCNRRSCM
jgi:hypothetical protein